MKIYTRTGDTGTTGLLGGPRVGKDDARIEAYGTVDELNAALGVARVGLAQAGDAVSLQLDARLMQVQHELFSIGAELAAPDPDAFSLRVIGGDHIARLEHWIDDAESQLEPLKQFILPAGTAGAAHVHLARCICRRAERRVVTLAGLVDADSAVSDSVIVYLNRLSDWLFVIARYLNHHAKVTDQVWVKP